MSNERKLGLFKEFMKAQYQSWCALFELITDIKPPKLQDLMRLK